MTRKPTVLIFNYAMSDRHPIFAHQIRVVRLLAESFPHISVITGSSDNSTVPDNVHILSCNWQEKMRFRNTLVYLKSLLTVMRRSKVTAIFSHMTTWQLLLSTPFLPNKPRILWYAHTSDSLVLRLTSFVSTCIVTSTLDSFPFQSNKVRCIGQAIPDEQFTFNNILREKKKFLVYGRLDESKRVHDIIELCKQKRTSVRDLTLTIIGSPSNQANQIWARNLKMLYNKDIELGWLEFHESVPREMAGFIFPKFDALIHSFQGSLDKVLVEAIFSGIPVVTINLPFVKEFGRWSQTNGLVLEQELDAFFSLPPAHILKESIRRNSVARIKHSENTWIKSLTSLLFEIYR